MHIRDLAPSDRAQWDALWAGYLSFYNSALAPDISDATFARLLDPAEPMFALVAEEDGALVGLVHNVVHRATWTLTYYCYLEDLFVAPQARGKGAGRALIEAAYRRADELGCARVYWHTHESNATARKLYDAVGANLGFIQYRRP
jgi:GNAT superfamily N-acetyltransferase